MATFINGAESGGGGASFANSAELRALLSDETGTGAAVFATSPTLVTPALGTPSSGVLTNCTGLPTAGLVDASVTLAKMANLTGPTVIGKDTGAGVPIAMTPAQARAVASLVRQTFIQQTTSVVTSTAVVPQDGTIPQESETTLHTSFTAFTPTQSDSIIRVKVVGSSYNSTSTVGVVACLFKNSETDALKAEANFGAGSQVLSPFELVYSFAPGSVSAITFKLRFGTAGGGNASMPTSNYFGSAGPTITCIIEELAP